MKYVWVLSDLGKVGTYRQCLPLAEWLEQEHGLTVIHKSIDLRGYYRWLPPQAMLVLKNPSVLQKPQASPLNPPYPDLIIAGGRQAVNAALVLRHFCPTLVLQNPRLHPRHFTLVIPPHHDGINGKNVLSTLGALHPIRPEQLQILRAQCYKGPAITVLIGGDSQHFRYTLEYIHGLAQRLHQLVKEQGHSSPTHLLITPSRRTRPELLVALQQHLQGISYELWDGQGENPYLRYLACADAVVVTGDSISMMSESCITGKPVYIYEIPHKSQRLKTFTQSLYTGQHACALTQDLDLQATFYRLDELTRLKPLIAPFLKDQSVIGNHPKN